MADYLKVNCEDVDGLGYSVTFSRKSYLGAINIVNGSFNLKYPKVKDIMSTVRGSELSVKIELNTTNLEIGNYLSKIDGDKEIEVRLERENDPNNDDINAGIIWSGFLKPDGIFRDYVTDYWETELKCIDGLGYLENTSFLDANGNKFLGKRKEFEILTRVLQLTGLFLNFKIYDFELYYSANPEDVPSSDNRALFDTFVNQERYQKDDQKEQVFNCQEVLDGLLKKYGATVFQFNNKWHVIRIKNFYRTGLLTFFEYTSGGIFLPNENDRVGETFTIGSQIDGFSPFHANSNQSIYSKGSLGAYKVLYDYGFVATIILNNRLIFPTNNASNLPNWIVTNPQDLTLVPQGGGFAGRFKPINQALFFYNFNTSTIVLNGIEVVRSGLSAESEVEGSANLKVKVTGSAFTRWFPDILGGSSQINLVSQIVLVGDDNVDYYLSQQGQWVPTQINDPIAYVSFFNSPTNGKIVNFSAEITTEQTPFSGKIQIVFFRPISGDPSAFTQIENVLINGKVDINIKGESHTTRRISKPTAIVDLEDKIYVGDNRGDIYVGSIEDENGNNTILWAEKNIFGQIVQPYYRLLEKLAYDRLNLSGANTQEFSGDVYGYMPYFSRFKINNFDETFMLTEYNWNIKKKVIGCKFESLNFEDVTSDIDYDFSFEGENVQRPQIE